MLEITFYKTANGDCPVLDFLLSLDTKIRAKADRDLHLLEEYGLELRLPYSRFLRDGLFELRIESGSNSARIFYFFFAGEKAIVTNGFLKKTRRTPQRELDKAFKYKKDWEERNHGE